MTTTAAHHRRHPVLVVSTMGQVLARVPVNRAAVLLAIGAAQSITSSPRLAVLRSPSTVVDVHELIMITAAAWRPWQGRTASSYASNHAILTRDGHKCAYCGRYADTVDHILPASRGGGCTFGNLVAACRRCNGAKADRTPAEAGMSLRWAPYVYDPWAADQERIHELFALAVTPDGDTDTSSTP